MSNVKNKLKTLMWSSGGSSYEPETEAYLAEMSTLPTTAQQDLINDLVVGLKYGVDASATWSQMEAFYIYMMHSQNESLINLIDPTQVMSITGSPTFTANSGWVCSAAGYIEHPETLASSAIFLQNDAHSGMYQEDEQTANAVIVGAVNGQNSFTTDFTGANQGYVVINGSYSGFWSHAGGAAHWGAFRNNSATYSIHRDGSLLTSVTNTSTSVPSNTWRVGGVFGTNTTKVSFTHYGSALTSAQMVDVRNIIETYRTGVAAL